jgi:hypothetical protein
MASMFRRTAALGTAMALAIIGAGTVAAAQAAGATKAPAFLSWRFIYRGSDNADFETVSAVNQRDAWVAGDFTKSTTALIWHWNGKSWRSVRVPDARGFEPSYSDESSASDVWFVGFQNTPAGQTTRALRWTGSGWRNQPMPAGARGFLSLRVLGWNDAWLADALSCPSDSPPARKCRSLLWHWNGTAWQQYELPVGISTLAGSSATNVWVSGYKGDGGSRDELRMHFYAYRWTGSSWHAVTLPHLVSVGCLPEVDTTSPRDVWMTTCAKRGNEDGLALHWNGHHWQHIWNLPSNGPLIDGKLGVWLSMTMRWTPDGVGFAALPAANITMSVPSATTVPGTTTLLAVGATWTSNSARARTFMAIIGGRFGPYRSAASDDDTARPAVRPKLGPADWGGTSSRWQQGRLVG